MTSQIEFGLKQLTESNIQAIFKLNQEYLEISGIFLDLKTALIEMEFFAKSTTVKNNIIDINIDDYENSDYAEDCDYYVQKIKNFLSEHSDIDAHSVPDIEYHRFVAKLSVQFFKDMRGIYSERINVLKCCNYAKCGLHLVSMAQNNQMIISMIVFDMHDDKIQAHYHIVKDICYIIGNFFNGLPDEKNLSTRLHKFASGAFDNSFWLSSPLKIMSQILKESGFVYEVVPAYKNEKWDLIKLQNKYNCLHIFKINCENELYIFVIDS